MSQLLTLKPRSVESTLGETDWIPLQGMPAVLYGAVVIHDTVAAGTLQPRIDARIGNTIFSVWAFDSLMPGPPRLRIMKSINNVNDGEFAIPAFTRDGNTMGPELRARWNLFGGDFDFSVVIQTETR